MFRAVVARNGVRYKCSSSHSRQRRDVNVVGLGLNLDEVAIPSAMIEKIIDTDDLGEFTCRVDVANARSPDKMRTFRERLMGVSLGGLT